MSRIVRCSERETESHLAQATLSVVSAKGTTSCFDRPILLPQFAPGPGRRQPRAPLSDLVNVPLLIINDFGLAPRPPEDETFHDLVAERYERAATILTSTLISVNGATPSPTNKMLGAATLIGSATAPTASSSTATAIAVQNRYPNRSLIRLLKEQNHPCRLIQSPNHHFCSGAITPKNPWRHYAPKGDTSR